MTPAGEKIVLDVTHDIPLLPEGFVCTAKQLANRGSHEGTGDHPEAGHGSGSPIGGGDRGPEGRGGVSPADEGADAAESHLLTHLPKRPNCDTCQIAKAQKKTCRRRSNIIAEEEPQTFGECLTVDHIVTVSDDIISVDGH